MKHIWLAILFCCFLPSTSARNYDPGRLIEFHPGKAALLYRSHVPRTFTGNADRVTWFTITIPAWQVSPNSLMVWYIISTCVDTTGAKEYYVTLNGNTIFSTRIASGNQFNRTYQFVHCYDSFSSQLNTFAHSASFGNQTNADPIYTTMADIRQDMNFVFEVDLTSTTNDITINAIDVWLYNR